MEIRNNCNCATGKKPRADAQTLLLISWETAHASSLSLSFPMNRSRITTPNSWVIWGWQEGKEAPWREGLSHARCSAMPATRYRCPPWFLLDGWMNERWMDVNVAKPLHRRTHFISAILTNKSLLFRLKPWKLLKLGKLAFLTQPFVSLETHMAHLRIMFLNA